ncbi:magnesium and cobalt transport protein CorA [Paenibacillus sp. RC84]|uniref:magnesium and cobalt transport protein CorA n=1 Tax=Paenibacillus sp. RC84 TaxID=3156252 RepID=UPI0035129BFF
MERTPKQRLYWLLRLYKDKEIQAETFCDEFHLTYHYELNYDELTETERVLFKEIAAVAARFSPFEEDHKIYPGVYFTTEDVERVVRENSSELFS